MRTPNQIIWAISRSSHILTDSTKFWTYHLPSKIYSHCHNHLSFPYSTWHIWIQLAPCLPISIRNLLALCPPVTDLGTESQPQGGLGMSQYALPSKKINQVLDRVSRISPVCCQHYQSTSLYHFFEKVNFVLSTLQEPKKEEEDQLGIFQILGRLEDAADNLLSRSVIFNRRISWGSSRFLTDWRLQLTICLAGQWYWTGGSAGDLPDSWQTGGCSWQSAEQVSDI